MATASATLSPGDIYCYCGHRQSILQGEKNQCALYNTGLNSFGGLKAQNNAVTLGLPVCTEQSFAKVVCSLRAPSQGKGSGGGALSSTGGAIAEIFKIAAIHEWPYSCWGRRGIPSSSN